MAPAESRLRDLNGSSRILTEPDVALTDYAVALECAAFAWLLLRPASERGSLRALFAVFFSSIGAAALTGGTVHGFFADENSTAGAVLWRCTLLGLGVATFAAWSIGGGLLFSERTARTVRRIAVAECAVYAIVVLAIDQRFLIAIVNYAPSVVFLGAALWILDRREPRRGARLGILGVVLTMLAAVLQRSPIPFHNAVYHVIQMAALGLIFLAGRKLRVR